MYARGTILNTEINIVPPHTGNFLSGSSDRQLLLAYNEVLGYAELMDL
jgi:hypothetical protein